jgi:hypothetical protein
LLLGRVAVLICGSDSTHRPRCAHTFREHSTEGGSAAGRLSHCSLQGRIKNTEKPGPVLVGQRSRSAGIRSQLPQVPGYLSTGERITLYSPVSIVCQ